MKIICVLIVAGIFCHRISAEPSSARAIQIISPKNHAFNLESDELNEIIKNDELKNRHVVVVGIAGAFRQGKSFLLNFFLKYLYAQENCIQRVFY